MLGLDWVLAGIYKTLEFLVFFKPLKVTVFLIFEFVRDIVWLIEWVIGLFFFCLNKVLRVVWVVVAYTVKELSWFLSGIRFETDRDRW